MHEVAKKLPYTNLIEGDIPPWVMRFIKHTGKAINTYSMIREGEKVLLSVSGGKDSLGLALALSLRRKWMPIEYELQALMINWIEHPIPHAYRERLQRYFSDLDIEFSIKGLPAIKCAGEVNIPDGEIFTAPVMGSINGTLSYNTPSVLEGFTYENIRLTFKNGRIVEAAANDTERINAVFDRDEGARAVGEFAIGVNPYITFPMKDTLFDEKIAGSFHFTPGNAYDDCDNGNRSSLHWDLVCIQTPEYGGGEMYFDGVLVRKDGRFTLPELDALNPENLK